MQSASFQCLRLSHSGNNVLNSNIFILEEKKEEALVLGSRDKVVSHSHKHHCSE